MGPLEEGVKPTVNTMVFPEYLTQSSVPTGYYGSGINTVTTQPNTTVTFNPPQFPMISAQTLLPFREFGEVVSIPVPELKDYDSVVQMAYSQVIHSYLRAKKESFPMFTGFPEIKVQETDFGRGVNVAWYVQVPKEMVISPEMKLDMKLDEDLWNS